MGTEAEGDVVVRVPGDVERLGVVEVGGVPIGRRVHENQLVAGANRVAVHLDVGGGYPTHVVDGSHPAYELLDGHGQVGAVSQQRPLVGSARQLNQRAGDDCSGGLRAPVQQ